MELEVNLEGRKLDLVAFGWALSGALVVLELLCWLAVVVLPGWQLAHGWLALFSAAEVGGLTNVVQGTIASFVLGWITAALLVTIYNRLV